ncbi:unnamed protein product, partial [Urochloa humidicola]
LRRHWRLLRFPRRAAAGARPLSPIRSRLLRGAAVPLLAQAGGRLREAKMNSVVRSAVQRVLRPAARRASGAYTKGRGGRHVVTARMGALDFWSSMSLGFVLSVIWHRFQNPPKTFHEIWLERTSRYKNMS